jgi:hypothetical protein
LNQSYSCFPIQTPYYHISTVDMTIDDLAREGK